MGSKPGSNAVVGVTAAIAAAAFVSLNNILTPQIYALGGGPITLVILRYIAMIAATGLWLHLIEPTARATRYEFRICLIVGAIYGVMASALLTAISHLPVSLAILIFYLFPLLTLVLDSLVKREKPNLVTLAATLTALLGLAIALNVGPVPLKPVGIMFALIAACAAATGVVISGHSLSGLRPVIMVYQTSKTGLLAALALILLEGAGPQIGDSLAFWTVTLAGTLAFGIAYSLMFVSIRWVGATRASVVLNLEPVITAILSSIVLREHLTPQQAAGAALVVISVCVAQLWSRRAKPANAP